MDMIPKTAVNLLQSLSMDYYIHSWRIQSNPNLTLSFRLEKGADDMSTIGHSSMPDKYYRAKAPSTRNRDMVRMQTWHNTNGARSYINHC